jgi:hypothetical protein
MMPDEHFKKDKFLEADLKFVLLFGELLTF